MPAVVLVTCEIDGCGFSARVAKPDDEVLVLAHEAYHRERGEL